MKRLVAQELTLSFVPDAEQRLWRTVMRRKYQITRNRVQLHNRLEALLEEAHIKVSSIVSDLLGVSARRMLQALADGETDPAALATLAAPRLRATPAQLCDAFQACPTLHPVYRRLLKLTLEELRVIEDHLGQLDQQMADLLAAHHDAVQRLAEVPGLGVDSAQQIIAEVGATAATFPSPKHLASWMGACPGNEESAGVNYSHRCPKGNRQMRRVLNQAANAAVKAKGTIFAVVYRRIVPRLGHAQAIGAITHRLCRLIWKILHERVRYEERGPAVSVEAKKVRARKMIRELRSLGYRVERLAGSIEQPGMIGRFSTLVDPRSGVNGLLSTGSPGFREVSLEELTQPCRLKLSWPPTPSHRDPARGWTARQSATWPRCFSWERRCAAPNHSEQNERQIRGGLHLVAMRRASMMWSRAAPLRLRTHFDERRQRLDDFGGGHDGGVVRHVDVERGVHCIVRIVRRRIPDHRDVVAQFRSKPYRRLDARVCNEPNDDESLNAVLLEL